jgi:hypothetical protein
MEKQKLIAGIVGTIFQKNRSAIEELKTQIAGYERDDFIWHYILQSFSTMGSSRGWKGLILTPSNYDRVAWSAIMALTSDERATTLATVFQAAKLRMPLRKAVWATCCYDLIVQMGGPIAVREKINALASKREIILFLCQFPGIGEKYANNIMMDVYHPQFRNSIAVDVRIKNISESIDVSFKRYSDYENFFLESARLAAMSGWEFDRTMYNFEPEIQRAILTSAR